MKLALSAQTVQFISQLGLLTFVDASQGPKGPEGTIVYKLVPTNGWHDKQRFPHEVTTELKVQGFGTTIIEGHEYYLVPDDTVTNQGGTLSYYAQKTAVGDVINPPGGGVNRVPDVLTGDGDLDHVVQADAVSKYVKTVDNWEDARKKVNEFNDRVKRQIGH